MSKQRESKSPGRRFALEQRGQISFHIEPVGAGFGPFDRSGKQPVFLANAKWPDGVLRPVVVNGHVRRFQEPHQIFLLGYQVPDSFGQFAAAGGKPGDCFQRHSLSVPAETQREAVCRGVSPAAVRRAQAKNPSSRGFSSACRFSFRSSGGYPANCRSRP